MSMLLTPLGRILWPLLAALVMIPGCLALLGCASGHGLMSPVLADIGMLLDKPAVQSTLDKWAARGSLHNPRVGGQLTTGFEVYTTGLDVEGEISGDVRSGGIDPALLDKLTQIMERVAEKLGVETPTEEPPKLEPPLGSPTMFVPTRPAERERGEYVALPADSAADWRVGLHYDQ